VFHFLLCTVLTQEITSHFVILSFRTKYILSQIISHQSWYFKLKLYICTYHLLLHAENVYFVGHTARCMLCVGQNRIVCNHRPLYFSKLLFSSINAYLKHFRLGFQKVEKLNYNGLLRRNMVVATVKLELTSWKNRHIDHLVTFTLSYIQAYNGQPTYTTFLSFIISSQKWTRHCELLLKNLSVFSVAPEYA
jgi:hypothetical protein